jgi:hypothetical protein
MGIVLSAEAVTDLPGAGLDSVGDALPLGSLGVELHRYRSYYPDGAPRGVLEILAGWRVGAGLRVHRDGLVGGLRLEVEPAGVGLGAAEQLERRHAFGVQLPVPLWRLPPTPGPATAPDRR